MQEKNITNFKRFKTCILKMEHYDITKLLKNSTVSKFVTKKKWIEVNGLSSDQYSVNKV